MGTLRVVIFEQQKYQRARVISSAMKAGAERLGYSVQHQYLGPHNVSHGDVGIFYGFQLPLPRIMDEYRNSGRAAIHVDLGYFGRTDGGHLGGYHKVAVNSRHPDDYFQKVKHDSDRVSRFDLEVEEWKRHGEFILIAGMSAKHAKSEGLAPQSWERSIIEKLREQTSRPIHYRPKPSDATAQPIEGTTFVRHGPIADRLVGCHAVVTHHSNVAIDAALHGIPSFSQIGVGTKMGKTVNMDGESPLYPEDRKQWFADIAYCQWNLKEMESGECLDHLVEEGLVPR